ncbi:GNAT family N-acetyltransferase [Vibrio variabilis]|uniref:GNAT family N-acetyltransferase n=1 Tax=Vibrio variabilis TaxID=990271 RepID=UPI000DDC26CB|nr:GNAT family N-acetyltransferase [Vibrio variabilis]
MSLSVRPAKQEDSEQLLELYRKTIRTVNCNDYNEMQVDAWAPLDLTKEVFEGYISRCCPFVVVEGEQILGYSDLQPDGLIDHFYCHHQAQRRGVGSLLMDTIFDKAKQAKLDRLYSFVSITAKPFYLHFGFTVVRPNEAEIRGVLLNNFLMERLLDNEQ